MAQSLGGDPKRIDTAAGTQVADAARDAFAASMGRSLLVAAGFALVGALVALVFLPARAADAPDALHANDDHLDLDDDQVTSLAATPPVGGAEAATARQEAIDEAAGRAGEGSDGRSLHPELTPVD